MEDALPAAEHEAAFVEGDGEARAGQGGFDVRVGVLLGVAEARAVLRDELAQVTEHVGRHVRVGVLVDGQPGRRVSHEEEADAPARARRFEPAPHLGGNLHQLLALVRAHANRFHKH